MASYCLCTGRALIGYKSDARWRPDRLWKNGKLEARESPAILYPGSCHHARHRHISYILLTKRSNGPRSTESARLCVLSRALGQAHQAHIVPSSTLLGNLKSLAPRIPGSQATVLASISRNGCHHKLAASAAADPDPLHILSMGHTVPTSFHTTMAALPLGHPAWRQPQSSHIRRHLGVRSASRAEEQGVALQKET